MPPTFLVLQSIYLDGMTERDILALLEQGGLYEGFDFVRAPDYDQRKKEGVLQLMFSSKAAATRAYYVAAP